jgi:hypothetical protein
MLDRDMNEAKRLVARRVSEESDTRIVLFLAHAGLSLADASGYLSIPCSRVGLPHERAG